MSGLDAMVGNFNPSFANEAPSALSSSSCSAQLGMMLATYFLLFFAPWPQNGADLNQWSLSVLDDW